MWVVPKCRGKVAASMARILPFAAPSNTPSATADRPGVTEVPSSSAPPRNAMASATSTRLRRRSASMPTPSVDTRFATVCGTKFAAASTVLRPCAVSRSI